MFPLRCQLCGGEVGLSSSPTPPDPATTVVRCFACTTTAEAEAITEAAAPDSESPSGGER